MVGLEGRGGRHETLYYFLLLYRDSTTKQLIEEFPGGLFTVQRASP